MNDEHCPGCTCEDEQPLPEANEPDSQSPAHVHEWGMWEIVKEGNITQPVENDDFFSWKEKEDRVIGNFLDQRRRCTTCGKYELDTQVSYAIED
jgi:hypothetical protein